jgi:hypothetical protein
MAICVKIWLSLDVCVNVWKYGHLCGNFTFIGYLCEISSMCENMTVSEVCAVSWSLVFSFWWSVCSFLKSCVQFLVKQKGDAPTERTSRILVKGDAPKGRASPFYLISTRKESIQIILHGYAPCANTQRACWHAYVKVHVPTDTCRAGARSTAWSTSYLKSLKHIDYCGFKS